MKGRRSFFGVKGEPWVGRRRCTRGCKIGGWLETARGVARCMRWQVLLSVCRLAAGQPAPPLSAVAGAANAAARRTPPAGGTTALRTNQRRTRRRLAATCMQLPGGAK